MAPVIRPTRSAILIVLAVLSAACNGGGGGGGGGGSPGPGPADVVPLFVDATAASGVAFTSLPRSDVVGYGQGVAVADFDGDGDLDLFLPQDLGPCALYRNDGGLAFTDVAAAAGVQVSAVEAHAKSAAFLDFDRDGDPDLFVGTAGDGNRLFRNEGDGTFTDVSAASGIGGGADFTVHAAPGDFDADGFPDLFAVNFVPADFGAGGTPTGAPSPDRLWHNQGDGTFTDEAAALGVADPRAGWAAQWLDLDGDRDQDLLVANDRFFYQGMETRDRAWINGGAAAGFAFTDGAAALGLDVSHSGMGFAAGDLDGDRLLDLYVTDIGGNELRLGSDAAPRPDRAPDLGVDAAFEGAIPQVAWGASILDLDRDGWSDLLVFCGLLADADPGPGSPDHQSPRLFLSRKAAPGTPAAWKVRGRVFVDEADAAGLGALECRGARAAVPADLDGDGDEDLVISTRFGAARILRNDTPARGPWYGVRLDGERCPREGWGAMIELRAGGRTFVQAASAGGQPGASLPPEWIFAPGPGPSKPARVTVRWPDGGVTEADAAPDGWTVVEEP
jgi:hypothetical protein